jgi:CheY-like chemotaxis protein
MPGQRRRYKILIADRVKNSREAMTEIFTDAGYAVSSASSGSETIEKLTRESYDLIFCDFDMPRRSGPEIVQMARALNRRAKIIVISSSDGPSVRSRVKEEGAFELLNKPLRKASLLKAARKALEAPATLEKKEVS